MHHLYYGNVIIILFYFMFTNHSKWWLIKCRSLTKRTSALLDIFNRHLNNLKIEMTTIFCNLKLQTWVKLRLLVSTCLVGGSSHVFVVTKCSVLCTLQKWFRLVCLLLLSLPIIKNIILRFVNVITHYNTYKASNYAHALIPSTCQFSIFSKIW